MTHYHLSAVDHGEKFEFTPKIPHTANPSECQKTARVCFAPSVWQCMIGVCGTSHLQSIIHEFLYVAVKKGKQPVVYETKRKLTKPPKLVSDYKVTGEMWATSPITCRRKGYVDLKYLMKHGEIRITKTPDVKFSEDFYEGWKAASLLYDVDWKKNPPV